MNELTSSEQIFSRTGDDDILLISVNKIRNSMKAEFHFSKQSNVKHPIKT